MRKLIIGVVFFACFLMLSPVSQAATWVQVGDADEGEVQFFLDSESVQRQDNLLKVITQTRISKPEKYDNIAAIDSQMEFKITERQERTLRQVQYDSAGKVFLVDMTELEKWKPINAGTLAEAMLLQALEVKK